MRAGEKQVMRWGSAGQETTQENLKSNFPAGWSRDQAGGTKEGAASETQEAEDRRDPTDQRLKLFLFLLWRPPHYRKKKTFGGTIDTNEYRN